MARAANSVTMVKTGKTDKMESSGKMVAPVKTENTGKTVKMDKTANMDRMEKTERTWPKRRSLL